MTSAAGDSQRPQGDLTIRHVFDAPLSLVFGAWTEPKHLAQWWGPTGFTNPVCELDARPGGALRIVMRGPDGAEYRMRGVFREPRATSRLHELHPGGRFRPTRTVGADGPSLRIDQRRGGLPIIRAMIITIIVVVCA